MSKLQVPIVSLFCGPGGMDLGFRQEGFRPVLALDDSQAAVVTYNFNDSREVASKRDLSELSGPELV
ncbi:MAG: DNA cytosine methyltransferase, partial [Verrucomicrobia bacterium]|nr:DNA cytosine methyltransferase [Verrucomicrobiota bacterium]